MRIEPDVYLIGSGANGFDMTDAYDCNVYLIDSGDGYVMFDAGAGIGAAQMMAICQRDGVDMSQIRHLFLTHGHGDHAGGVAHFADRLDFQVTAGGETARILRDGDEDAVSLTDAKAGGIYPKEYVYRAYPVENVIEHGASVQIGSLTIEAHFTPGHSHDHFSYLVTGVNNKVYLVGGDAIFYGGKIVLQNTYDCSVPQSIQTIQYLATLDFDALLAGHLNFSLNNGKRHIESACVVIEQMGCPASI